MQVTSTTNVNCAIIGGEKPIDFKISTNPEFFNILSKSLYSNPVKAVAREILCNAWDAHIEANQVRLVEVTTTETTFSIKDYGNGIPKEKMAEIYAIYGASTKQNDENQTGGFGLGCKAPFALVDNFEVISCNNGIKTVYQLNKSSISTDGKPAIVPIISIPTEESGLTVIITAEDYVIQNLLTEALKIIYGADIPTLVNGVKKYGVYIDKSEGFAFDTSISINSKIAIRYGNVIYPINGSDLDKLDNEYNQVRNILDYICYNSDKKLIFLAPSNSLVLSPSRETLHYCDKTIDTIKTIFDKFLKRFHKIPEKDLINCYYDAFSKRNFNFISDKIDNSYDYKYIHNYKEYLECYTYHHFRRSIYHNYLAFASYVKFNKDSGEFVKELTNPFLKTIKGFKQYSSNLFYKEVTTWIYKKIFKPIIVKADSLNIPLKNLNIIHNTYRSINIIDASSFIGEIDKYVSQFLKKEVYFCKQKKYLIDYLVQKGIRDTLFYKVTNKKELEKYQELFTRLHYKINVIDIPKIETKEKRKQAEIKCYSLAKGKSISFYWSDVYNNPIWITKDQMKTYDAVIFNPKSSYFYDFKDSELEIILEKLSSNILVVTSNTLYNKILSLGVPSLKEFVKTKLKEKILTDPELQYLCGSNVRRLSKYFDVEKIKELMYMCSIEHIKIKNFDFLLKYRFFQINNSVYNLISRFNYQGLIPLSPNLKRFVKDILRSNIKYLPALDCPLTEEDKEFILKYILIRKPL